MAQYIRTRTPDRASTPTPARMRARMREKGPFLASRRPRDGRPGLNPSEGRKKLQSPSPAKEKAQTGSLDQPSMTDFRTERRF